MGAPTTFALSATCLNFIISRQAANKRSVWLQVLLRRYMPNLSFVHAKPVCPCLSIKMPPSPLHISVLCGCFCKILRQATLKSMLWLSVFNPDHEYLAAICLCPKICTISSKLKILPCESKPTFSMRPSKLEARSCKCP